MDRFAFDIFISYKRSQRDAAKWLADQLTENGLRVWWDADLVAGDNFIMIIKELIEKSRLCVVLWDQDAVRSDYVVSEALIGHQKGRYKPFTLVGPELTLPPPFTAIHAGDISNWKTSPEVVAESVISSVRQLLRDDVKLINNNDPIPDIREWVRIDNSRNLVDFEKYLQKFGEEGLFFELATERSARLRARQATPHSRADQNQQRLLESTVRFDGGTFMMGTPDADTRVRYEEERPQHLVKLAPFRIGRAPVTFDEYAAFCEDMGRSIPDDNLWGRTNRPVVNVSVEEAMEYCRWQSDQTGLEVRLPSEAEWEFAARDGAQTIYPWGDLWENAKCNGAMIEGRVAKVGAFGHSSYGLADMLGNVWEYCADHWTDTHDGASGDGRPRTDGEPDLVPIRGGAWDSKPDQLRPAMRWMSTRHNKSTNTGFRIAVSD